MMRRTIPLLENVLVAALAGVGLHEELRRDLALARNLRRAGKERPGCAIAFVVHGTRSDLGVPDDEALAPGIARVLGADRDDNGDGDHAKRRNPGASVRLAAAAEPPSRQQRDGQP